MTKWGVSTWRDARRGLASPLCLGGPGLLPHRGGFHRGTRPRPSLLHPWQRGASAVAAVAAVDGRRAAVASCCCRCSWQRSEIEELQDEWYSRQLWGSSFYGGVLSRARHMCFLFPSILSHARARDTRFGAFVSKGDAILFTLLTEVKVTRGICKNRTFAKEFCKSRIIKKNYKIKTFQN